MARKYYTFSGEYEFRKIAKRYGVEPDKLIPLIGIYITGRHDEHFSLCLAQLVGVMEPFVKNELKPAMQELCEIYDAIPLSLKIDDKGNIRLYVI